MKVAGLVLAAGSGSRLGTPKALVELDGERLVDRAARVLAEGGCAPIVVVAGAVPLEVAGTQVVSNAAWATGMGSSLRAGLAALARTEADAVVVALVDQPDIPAAAVARLIAAARAGARVAVATYGGKRRNPALFARGAWDEVAHRAEGDQGARAYLAAHAAEVTGVPCDDLGDPADIDTPTDLARVRRRASSGSIRIGVAGVGRIGTVHAENLTRLLGPESVLLADADPGRARAAAGAFPAQAVGSTEALLDAGIQGLVVATPTDTHTDLVIRAARAGLPVFCEKPIAADLAGTRRVLALVTETDARVQVGFQRRFDPGYVAARADVAGGRLGRVHTITAHTLDPTPPALAYVRASGGIFRDCCVHDFDIVRWVSGREVVLAQATGANLGEEYLREAGDVDAVAAVLTLSDGSLALVSASRYNRAGYDVRMEVRGHDDGVAVGWGSRAPIRLLAPDGAPSDGVGSDGVGSAGRDRQDVGSDRIDPTRAGAPPAAPFTDFLERFAQAYAAEMTAFVGLVTDGGPSPCSVADALAALEVAEACERSRRQGRPVPVAELRGDS